MNTQNTPARIEDFEQRVVDLERTQILCQKLMKTPHYAKLGVEGIFAIVSKAKSLGMDQIEALNGGLYYLQGKVGMPAETMAAMIRQRGHSISKDPKSSDSICILHGRRADTGDIWTVQFSVDDARRAGLMKNLYEKYPGAMLYCRSMSMLARQLFPDIIKGAGYTMDELKEIACSTKHFSYEIQQHDEPIVEVITTEQYLEIRELLQDCDDMFRSRILKSLAKFNIFEIDKIHVGLYDRIKTAIITHLDEKNQSSIHAQGNVVDADDEVIND